MISKDGNSLGEIAQIGTVEQELRSRLAQQEALAELGQQAMLSTDLNQFIQDACDRLTRILEADFCELLELLPGSQQMVLKAGVGWKPGYVGQVLVKAGAGSQGGFTLQAGEPVIVENLMGEKRFTPPALLVDHNVTSGMTVIILGRGKPYGILGIFTKETRFFSLDDANFLQSLANLLASAIDRLTIEQELRASRDQLSVVLEGIAEGITVQGSNGEIRYANDIAARLIGFEDREELINTPLSEFMNKFEVLDEQGEPFPMDQLPGRRALKGEVNASEVVRFRIGKTGVERWSLVRASPVYDPARREWLAVNIFQDITDLKYAELTQRFMADVGEALVGSSLDYRVRLEAVVKLAVNNLADWCSIHLVDAQQEIQEIAVAHMDPKKIALVREIQEKYPPNRNSGVYQVIRTGKPVLFPLITGEMIKATSIDEQHLKMVRALGVHSAIILPLIARDQTMGAISLVWSESNHHYNDRDIFLANELARRAALSIDNVRLYQEASSLNAELESKVIKRTAQLERLIDNLRAEISRRHQIEKELIKNETLFSDLFEFTPDPVCLIDQDGKIVRVNAQVEKVFGYQRNELEGKPVELLAPIPFSARNEEFRQSYLQELELRSLEVGLELYGTHKGGQEFPIEVILGPVKIEQDWLVICVIRDITLQKRIQAELAEVQHRLMDAQEAERLRLAQELHDNAIQELFSLSYLLDDVEQNRSSESTDEIDKELRTSKEMIQHTIMGLRNLSVELRPPILISFGLEQAVHSYLEHFGELHPEITVHAELAPDGQYLDERMRLSLYRIFQHALSNILRHAQAKNIWVRLNWDAEQVYLDIQDDGIGFDLPSRWVDLARQGHLGLVGTEERVRAIGGQLEINTAPGKGTLIRVTVPLKET